MYVSLGLSLCLSVSLCVRVCVLISSHLLTNEIASTRLK